MEEVQFEEEIAFPSEDVEKYVLETIEGNLVNFQYDEKKVMICKTKIIFYFNVFEQNVGFDYAEHNLRESFGLLGPFW